MWERVLIAAVIWALEKLFKKIEAEKDEKKKLQKAVKLEPVVAAVKSFQAKHPTA